MRQHLKWIIVYLFCLAPLGTWAETTYRSTEIKRLVDILQLKVDSLHEGTNIFHLNNHPIKLVLKNGQVSFVGYSLFSDELKAIVHTPILDFLERYTLQLAYPKKDRPREKMLREDRFKIEKGSLSDIVNIKIDDVFSYSCENRRYVASWIRDGQVLLSVSFPAEHELISGENKIESEKNVESDMLCSQFDSIPSVNKSLLTPTAQQNYFIRRGELYLRNLFNSDSYYKCQNDSIVLISDISYPLESAANMMLCLQNQSSYVLKIKQVMYGFKKKYFDVPLNNWISYCQNNDCKLFFGVESFSKDMIRASVIAVNIAEEYNHLLFVNIPLTAIESGEGIIEAQLETFIPMHNVTNLFAKYNTDKNKQPKIYE